MSGKDLFMLIIMAIISILAVEVLPRGVVVGLIIAMTAIIIIQSLLRRQRKG